METGFEFFEEIPIIKMIQKIIGIKEHNSAALLQNNWKAFLPAGQSCNVWIPSKCDNDGDN